jgi:hypothetical protein
MSLSRLPLAKPPSQRAVAGALKRQAARNGYEISVEERDQRLDEQSHRCGVCQRVFKTPSWHLNCTYTGKLVGRRIGTSPAVDHDHATGLVRGLLCRWCNHDIVSMVDRHPIEVRAAQKYVRNGGFTPD